MTDRHVLFFGDSWVVGVGDPTGLGWVGRVTAAAHGAGVPVTAYNLGVRGETSADIAERWHLEAAPRLSRAARNYAVFSFGANDTELVNGRPRVEPGASAQALASCLARAQSLGVSAFVVGPAPIGDGGRIERIRQLSEGFEHVTGEFEVPYVDVQGPLLHSTRWVVETAGGDGAHPREGGYAEFARVVCERGFTYWLRTGMQLPRILQDDRYS